MAECRDCVHCKYEKRGVHPWRYENPGRCGYPAGGGYIVDIGFPWCSKIVTKRHEELVSEADTLLTAIPGVCYHSYAIRNGAVVLRVHKHDVDSFDTIDAIVEAECALIAKFPGIYIDLEID